jgi:hypothetical protein
LTATALLAFPVLLASCSSTDNNVAALSATGKDSGREQQDQRDVAGLMVDCLGRQGLATEFTELDDAERQVEVRPSDTETPWQICWTYGCTEGGGESLSEAARKSASYQFDAMGAAKVVDHDLDEGRAKWVFIGNKDMTDLWQGCETETGYRVPVYVNDRAEELIKKQEIAKASAAWAQCARDNGQPSTKGPQPPVADDWATEPRAVLPSTITPDQLRTLLGLCPLVDKVAHGKADDALEANPELSDQEYWELAGVDPVVGFDVPCLDGTDRECGPGVWEDHLRLIQILEEPQNEYLRERNSR